MNIQWYPGHMTKAKRDMKEDMKLIDLVIELVDARVPLSSRNPDIDDLGAGKARMVLLNKSDLADERQNARWAAWFEDKGIHIFLHGPFCLGHMTRIPLNVHICKLLFYLE